MKVGYLGPRATFTDIAVRNMFPNDTGVPYITIPSCMDAVVDGEVEVAVVPLENALEGSVNITLDYLVHEVDLPILGEIRVPIRQHFMVHPNNAENWRETDRIMSHSHAIAQCHKFLHKEFKGVFCENTTSTAAAAQFIIEHPEIKAAAIANELAAKEYGLTIVQPDIHDLPFNHTSFVVVAKQPLELSEDRPYFIGYKTTLMVTLPSDHPGVLHTVLSAFAWRKLNLSKIESRPSKTGLGNYFFIIDIAMKMDEVLLPGAIAELEAVGCGVNLLGSYPVYHIK
ncbi:prephenate dehydratase [Bacillus marasmi]|uniref:prephenate dehydratase n=1 Tax=Bacillus marasmi TaxID=1926279 RepID=UPI0011C794A0|nr:prephenate dehydratase [Bacillus marasmi]